MQLELPCNNLLPGIPALSATASIALPGMAAAVHAQPNVVAASLNAAGRVAAQDTWYPDIQPLDLFTDDKLVIPGYGESLPVCGSVRFTITCPENQEHYTQLRKYECHKSSCPICWTTWASRLSRDAQLRIDGSRAAYDRLYKARHISLSPDYVPFQYPTADCLKWLYKEGNRLTKLLGITGCCVIVHPYRIKEEMKFLASELASRNKMNRYQWAIKQENPLDYLYFSPHLHLIAYGKLMNSDDFHELTGWIYRNHDDNQKAGREINELRRTIYYLLTHAWTKDNSVVLRYWGDLSNKRLQKIKIDERKEPILCPICEKHMVKKMPDVLQFDGSFKPMYQDINNCDHAYRKIPVYVYKKRTKIRVQSVMWGK
jgi:hypothetical protein